MNTWKELYNPLEEVEPTLTINAVVDWSAEYMGVNSTGSISMDSPSTHTVFTFGDGAGDEVGRLFVEDNRLNFSGSLGESAIQLFEYLRHMVDNYILEQLRGR